MTTLDELKHAWTVHDREIKESIRINRRLLLQTSLRRVQSPVRGLKLGLALEIGACAVGIAVFGGFLGSHIAEPRFIWPAVLLEVWLIATMIASIRQMVLAETIDYEQPVAEIQRQLIRLRISRLRAFRWAILTGQIFWWIPYTIVFLKLVYDVDAYRFFSPAFILVNLLFGCAMIPTAIWAARRSGKRVHDSAFLRGLIDSIAGRSLTTALHRAAVLSEFESE